MSDTLGEGTTLYDDIILSGYSSLILEISSVPMPAGKSKLRKGQVNCKLRKGR